MGDKEAFKKAVRLVIDKVHFNLDSRVQVFEVTIRVLGGLLSAHQLAVDNTLGFKIEWYKGELLALAKDLGDRLMPAFESPTHIPFPRVNLMTGVLSYEVPEACSAGAGTLILEFGVLSRLTGNPKYEKAAKLSLETLWKHRSSLNLVGNTIDILKATWKDSNAGIGAGIDSIYEYMLKAYVLFGEDHYLEMFDLSYSGIMASIADKSRFVYQNINMFSGKRSSNWIDSLAAFFPGLQVLAGDLENAIKHHYMYFLIWKRYGALPERYDYMRHITDIPSYPLRPELIESTYMLYQATKDPFYLRFGEMMLNDLELMARVKCGFASLRDVRTGEKEERMESFFLSETLKYLYLLFDEGTDTISIVF